MISDFNKLLEIAAGAVEHQLIQRRLHHLHRGRQFFEVDEPAARIVRGRQERRRRPAGPVGVVAPRDATQVDGIEEERPDVDILAAGIVGDLLGNGALGGAGRSPYQRRLAGLDQKCEGGGELAGSQRVVGGDGVGIGHRHAPEWLDGGAGAPPGPGLRPAGSRNSRSVRRTGMLLACRGGRIPRSGRQLRRTLRPIPSRTCRLGQLRAPHRPASRRQEVDFDRERGGSCMSRRGHRRRSSSPARWRRHHDGSHGEPSTGIS